jgi:IS1 family transposase
MYVLDHKKQLAVLRLLIDGSSVSTTSRFTGVHRDTCTRLMTRFANACQKFLNLEMRDLQLNHVEIDELWTYCRKKRYSIKGDEPDLDKIGEFYIFVALDQETRLIPAHRVGRRTKETTEDFIFELASRLKFPRPHLSDRHAYKGGEYKPFVRISTDAFPAYPDAIRAAFGPYAAYGQIKKHTENRKLKSITRRVFRGDIDPKDITTSLVERSNLNSRNFMKRLMRKSTGYSKKLENLVAATAVHFAHYNYCWKLKTLKTSPAVKAGLMKVVWTLEDLYDHLRQRWPEDFLEINKQAG